MSGIVLFEMLAYWVLVNDILRLWVFSRGGSSMEVNILDAIYAWTKETDFVTNTESLQYMKSM